MNELRLHLGDRRTGHVFPSPRGGHYSSRRIQQIVKERARDAEITKRVYPHLLRHTVAQRLADEGMPENLLQTFSGHIAATRGPVSCTKYMVWMVLSSSAEGATYARGLADGVEDTP